MFPINEAETITLYTIAQKRLGWRIACLQTTFPDAVIENGAGVQLRAEFEHEAKNFKSHDHDPAGCDLIICWRNNWPNAPLPVWALEDCAQHEAATVGQLVAGWKELACKAEKKRGQLPGTVTLLEARDMESFGPCRPLVVVIGGVSRLGELCPSCGEKDLYAKCSQGLFAVRVNCPDCGLVRLLEAFPAN